MTTDIFSFLTLAEYTAIYERVYRNTVGANVFSVERAFQAAVNAAVARKRAERRRALRREDRRWCA